VKSHDPSWYWCGICGGYLYKGTSDVAKYVIDGTRRNLCQSCVKTHHFLAKQREYPPPTLAELRQFIEIKRKFQPTSP
jgi:hypothetical protein